MLATLTVLTMGAAGLAVMHLAASWVIVPPGIMVAGFLVLLREAAHTDAERLRAQLTGSPVHVGTSQQTGASRGAVPSSEAASASRTDAAAENVPATQVGQAVPSSLEPGLTAQVIDLSSRIGDQVYDQYSDAAERAVGD